MCVPSGGPIEWTWASFAIDSTNLRESQNEHREHHRENSAECRHCSTPYAGAAKAVVAAFLEACATIEVLDLEVRPYKVAPVSDLVMPE